MKITKRILSAVTSAVCTVTACVSVMSFSSASAATLGDLEYENWGGYLAITGCSSTAKSVSVPADIQSVPIKVIDDEAFMDCTSLEQVTLNEGITSIGNKAFSGCGNLKSVNIPSTVVSVGANAFDDTDVFGDQEKNDVWYVGNWAVKCNPSATAVDIKSGTIGISDRAFYHKNLETIILPDTIKLIGKSAFESNLNVKKVVIPGSVEKIGDGAFYGCSNLITAIFSGSSLKDIGSYAFYGCKELQDVTIPSSLEHMGRDAFKNTYQYDHQVNDQVYIDSWLVYCRNNPDYALECKSGTKGIADYALNGLNFIISAILPNGVKYIGSHAFDECTRLSQVTIPDTVKTIGDFAFSKTQIPDVDIPESVESVGASAFYDCSNLKEVIVRGSKCVIAEGGSYQTIPSGVLMHVVEKSKAYEYASDPNHKGIQYDYKIPGVKAGNGDANQDNKTNIYDAICIAKYAITKKGLTEEAKKAADVTGDGEVNLYDAIRIAKFVLSKEKDFEKFNEKFLKK